MDSFLIFYRVIAVAIVATWAWRLLTTSGKPVDWVPRGYERSPVRITRDRLRIVSVLGVVAGLAVFAFSFFLASLPR
jgi:hypothetical protein